MSLSGYLWYAKELLCTNVRGRVIAGEVERDADILVTLPLNQLIELPPDLNERTFLRRFLASQERPVVMRMQAF